VLSETFHHLFALFHLELCVGQRGDFFFVPFYKSRRHFSSTTSTTTTGDDKSAFLRLYRLLCFLQDKTAYAVIERVKRESNPKDKEAKKSTISSGKKKFFLLKIDQHHLGCVTFLARQFFFEHF